MHESILSSLAAGLLLVPAAAQNPVAEPTAADLDALLTIGDPAPALDLGHWLKGDEVREFAPGSRYIVEFWATWCAPCVASMPHLSDLQERYRDRGVTVIGISNEPLQTVVEFLCREAEDGALQNARARYALATDPDGSAWRDYLDAACATGVPTAFLIGADGRIDWIGYPADLEPTLQAVLAGNWDRAARRAERVASSRAALVARRATREVRAAREAGDWPRLLAVLEQQIELEGADTLRTPVKLRLLLNELADRERARDYASALVDAAWPADSWTLMQVAWAMVEAPPATRDLDLALRAAERADALAGGEDETYPSMLARVCHERGDQDRAVAAQERAIAILAGRRQRVPAEHLTEFEADLARMADRLRAYREGRDRR